MKIIRKICVSVIILSVLADAYIFVGLIFSNGFVGAAISKGIEIMGLPSIVGASWMLFPLVPIILIVFIWSSSNKDKYPTLEKIMLIVTTLFFLIPGLFSVMAIKLSDQKFASDRAVFEASGRVIVIKGCQFKIYPNNSSYQELGNAPGQQCSNPIEVWVQAHRDGLTNY